MKMARRPKEKSGLELVPPPKPTVYSEIIMPILGAILFPLIGMAVFAGMFVAPVLILKWLLGW